MKEIEVITIDNKDYGILKEVKHANVNYLYLTNIYDEDDTLIRKTMNNEDNVYPLDNEEEFNLACGLLFKDLIIKESTD